MNVYQTTHRPRPKALGFSAGCVHTSGGAFFCGNNPMTIKTTESAAVIVWWSTFYQRWNITPFADGRKGETRTYLGRPITSDAKLLQVVANFADNRYPEIQGLAVVLESAYSAIWCNDKDELPFLEEQVWKLVCDEV